RRARDHLLCLAQSNGIPRSRVDEVLRIVGLENVARRRAKGFSLGMGQRLGIASALLGDPAVLIFDEPVNGLDPDGIHWVRTLMRAFAAEGRTGMDSAEVGRLAAAHGIALSELIPVRASLEEAFMELTRESVEYQAAGATR